MWTRTWQWACREEHVAEPGDYYVYEIGPHSVLIVRDAHGEIKAYVNACLHRGTKFRSGGADGAFTEIRCPYHGWAWELDGSLKRVPYAWDAPHVNERDFSLPEVAVGLWGGFVFVNLDSEPTPFDEYLAPIPEHLANFDMSSRFVELHIEKELHCNWKAAIEAFIENYHTQETHPQLLYGSDDEGTQYDVFTNHVSRFFCAFGVSSPSIEPPPTEQELVDMMLVGDRSVLGDAMEVKPGESARIVMARVLRQVLGEKYRVDLDRYTDTEMIDVSQYGLFPNMVLFPQLSLPMVYRFRPIGGNPNRTLFELLILRPAPDQGRQPPPARPHRLEERDSFTTVPGFDPNLGEVYDQDTGNLRAQQEGFHASRKRGATLLNYQEVRIRHLHQTLEGYL
jgi:nitrite reductase/ring-hydroxylating ferredoxin subunit